MPNKRIELLAPARDLGTGRVAVDCGADAVYIGGPGFGARRAAGNSLEDIAELVRYARPFGVRVYATLNTLLFDSELTGARSVAQGLLDAGVDALIVQDMAWLRMGLSGVEFHASTQTSNIAPEDVAFLGRAGFRRVILERALSIDEIREVRAACPDGVELEAFVHGAICVAYSGRCFMSRSTGSAGGRAGETRSGNRGDCSQPCRLAYDLTDGSGNVLIGGRHLLSVRDLDLSAHLGELLDAGVSSFKIEGRLKDAFYVRNVVSRYRGLLDEAMEARPGLQRASVGVSVPDFTPDPAKSFTRGGTDYFFGGGRNADGEHFLRKRPAAGVIFPKVASFDTPKAMGEFIGTVEKTGCERTGNRFFTFAGTGSELAAGDGICFFAGGELRGTNINRAGGGRVYPDRIEGIDHGTEIYRNYDHAFVRALDGSRMRRRIGVGVRVSMGTARVEAIFTDETGVPVSVAREGVFDCARDHSAAISVVREQFSRSGDTIFEVRGVEITDIRFVPVSMLAAMRREGFALLLQARELLAPRRSPVTEDMAARFPRTRLTAAENVTNRLAERFYRDHGVEEIEPAIELRGATPGEAVMRTRYCIRRETGRCLLPEPSGRDGSHSGGELYLERGDTRWRLSFDCGKCEMTVIKI